MLLSSLLFASMAVCIKFASAYFNNAELVFYRGCIGIVFMAVFARASGVSLRTRYPAMHAWRSVIGVMSMSAWFYAITHLPLATAMTLNYMSSVWVAVFLVSGTLFLRRVGDAAPRQGMLVSTIVASFIGVVMLLRPAIAQNQATAGLIGLFSGMGSAFAYMQVMAISRLGEPESRTVFYFAVGTLLAGALGMAVVGTSPWHWQQAWWLLPLGVLASLGQLCMTKAYSLSAKSNGHSSTLMVANLQYSGIVFGALYGLVLFGDQIPPIGWAGMALIVTSAIAATVLRARATADVPSDTR